MRDCWWVSKTVTPHTLTSSTLGRWHHEICLPGCYRLSSPVITDQLLLGPVSGPDETETSSPDIRILIIYICRLVGVIRPTPTSSKNYTLNKHTLLFHEQLSTPTDSHSQKYHTFNETFCLKKSEVMDLFTVSPVTITRHKIGQVNTAVFCFSTVFTLLQHEEISSTCLSMSTPSSSWLITCLVFESNHTFLTYTWLQIGQQLSSSFTLLTTPTGHPVENLCAINRPWKNYVNNRKSHFRQTFRSHTCTHPVLQWNNIILDEIIEKPVTSSSPEGWE